jgi:tetratricopeptide (TPR) repeat protein
MKFIQTAVTLIALTSVFDVGTASAAGYPLKDTVVAQRLEKSQVLPTPASSSLFEEGMKKQEHEDYAGAISLYTEFLKTHPDHLEAYSNRGFARAMLEDLRGALSDFDRAIALAPNNADVYNGRGNVNAMAGNLSASIRDFNRSIRYDRNFADAYYNRAISRHGLGDRRGARSDLSRAAKLFQQQQDIGGYQQAREWIDKLK